ncbi:hypothetical protein [Vulcanisaeta souniana]|uniref:hypothetical protein n=1 Tax=Vulcanisaeta souniana TaxID=164452 RepID=UPI001FB41CE5|nr:hypothetical protein [Vulcanisaeta souniana]
MGGRLRPQAHDLQPQVTPEGSPQAQEPSLFSMLYNSFTVFKPKNHNRTKLPTLEELRQVLSKIESIEAKTYFIILAETGLRPGGSHSSLQWMMLTLSMACSGLGKSLKPRGHL